MSATPAYSKAIDMLTAIVLLYVVVPTVLAVWFLCLFLRTHTRSVEGGQFQPVPPSKLFLSLLVPFVMSLRGLKKGNLSSSGAVAALAVGLIMTLINYCFMAAMLTFYIICSKATKFRAVEKSKFEKDVVAAGARNWVQVCCNGGAAALLTLFYYLDVGCVETTIDFQRSYNASWWSIAVLAAICCCAGDTLASELGPVFPLSQPYLITDFSKVPKGTNGGISVAGTIASILGGSTVAAAYLFALHLCADGRTLDSSPPQWPIVIIGALSGFIGSAVDSLLGATLQFSGEDTDQGYIVEQPGPNIRQVSGSAILDNGAINLLSSLITCVLMPRIALLLWPYPA